MIFIDKTDFKSTYYDGGFMACLDFICLNKHLFVVSSYSQ